VQSRATGQVEYQRAIPVAKQAFDEIDLRLHDLDFSARGVMFLRKVLFQHPFAEFRVVPRNFSSLDPRLSGNREVHDVGKIHERYFLPLKRNMKSDFCSQMKISDEGVEIGTPPSGTSPSFRQPNPTSQGTWQATAGNVPSAPTLAGLVRFGYRPEPL
jgi:hypothetical protein